MALLQCCNVSFAYEGRSVLSGLNFHVNTGDYLCIVGENGAGKSTLLKGLLHLKAPASGTITIGDGLKAKDIGYLPQQTPIQRDFPASVYEVIRSGRLNKRGWHPFYTAADQACVQAKMQLLEISDLKNACYRDLSGGQQQRVLLARALCATEKLLLLDEPVTGLDPVMTSQFYKLLRTLHKKQNLTIVMVSHDVANAVTQADHILHIGRQQLFFGTTAAYQASTLGRCFLEGGLVC